MNKEIKDRILFIIIIILVIISFIIPIIDYNRVISKENKIVYDTTYNHVTLDSIRYHIIEKDSIIYNYKNEMQYEIQKNITSSDSDAIKLFYQLLSN